MLDEKLQSDPNEAGDERMLVARAQTGDADAFRTLYRRYLPRVYAYIAYRVGHADEAEDLTAEVFVRVVEGLPRFEDRGDGAFAAWLFRIAHSRVGDHHRRKRYDHVPLDALPPLAAPDLPPEPHLDRQEQFARLRAHIGALSPRRQEIITLRYYGGLRNRDIAAVLGLDERTVAAHLSRGLDDLSRRYAAEAGKEPSHDRQ
jgi:RNA polymerase sigma-70 factor (ECF subfamily)